MLWYYDKEADPDTAIEIYFRCKGKDGRSSTDMVKIPFTDIVTEKNAMAWSRYMQEKMPAMLTAVSAATEAFQNLQNQFEAECQAYQAWRKKEDERKKEKEHRRPISSNMNYIRQGLALDYDSEYGGYVQKSLDWDFKTKDDFSFLLSQLDKWATKTIPRHCGNGRPDVAFSIAKAAVKGLPGFLKRRDVIQQISERKAKRRLCDIFRHYIEGLYSSALQWNNEDRRIEANQVITSAKKALTSIGLDEEQIGSYITKEHFTGDELQIRREPNRYEAREIAYYEHLRRRQEKELHQQEAERTALIKLNPAYEERVKDDYHDVEGGLMSAHLCRHVKNEVKSALSANQPLQAVTSFLQCIKTIQKHFVEKHHWEYFDDFYAPDYDCRSMYEEIRHHLDSRADQESESLLAKGAAELRNMEAFRDYGILTCLSDIH